MGVYYYYVNKTKRQYYCIDPSARNIKKSWLGRNIGSRSLSYLLLNNDPYFTGIDPHPLVGSWVGDHFFVTGDDYDASYESIVSEYSNIAQEILDMIIDVAPWDLYLCGGPEWIIGLMSPLNTFARVDEPRRRKLLKLFREQHYWNPTEDLKRVIAALRPKSSS